MAKKFDIDKFNRLLFENNQKLYAETVSGKEIMLSNGLVLNQEQDVRLCKKRVMTGSNIWRENFDKLYSLDPDIRTETENKCRSHTSKKGGYKCQLLHRDSIKKNLNTGTPWNKGTKGQYPYSYKHSNATKKKISLANQGKNNGMFGKAMSKDQRRYRSEIMRTKILTGEFTPNSNNRNTHWEAEYKGLRFRSSWEAIYQSIDPKAEYESLRIPYSFKGNDYVYIVDFVNHSNKTVVEVKPKELLTDEKIQAKIKAAKEWCEKTGYEFIIVDKEYLLSTSVPSNLHEFDVNTQNKIRKLYESS